MSKQTLLDEIRATHEPLAAVVGTLADDAWAEPLPDMDGWTRKDALAHVGWWSDHSARVITALRAGRVPYERDPDLDIDAQNRSILEEFRDRDPAEVRAYEVAAFERLVAAVEAASDEDLFTADRFPWLEEDTLATAIAWDSTRHYPEHLPHLTAYVARHSPGEVTEALDRVVAELGDQADAFGSAAGRRRLESTE